MNTRRIDLRGADGAQASFGCAPGETVLAAARRAGLRLRSACKGGGCAICAARLEQGAVGYAGPVSQARLAACPPGTVFLCQATPTEDCCFEAPWQWSVIDSTPLSRRIQANMEE